MNAAAVARGRLVVPTKIANASCLVIVAEAARIASAKEKTMPTFANVRSSPEAMPYSSSGAAFITAELLEGKKLPAPIAPTMLTTTTTHSPV